MLERLTIDRGRHEDDLLDCQTRDRFIPCKTRLDSLVPLEDLPQQADEQICIDATLVRLVNNHMADPLELGIAAAQPTKHDTRRTEGDSRIAAGTLLATNDVPDRL